jgi:hypothetical protein
MPVQRPQIVPNPKTSGRKLWKGGKGKASTFIAKGTLAPKTPSAPAAAKIPKGPVFDVKCTFIIRGDNVGTKPLTPFAEKLLLRYISYAQFFQAVQDGASIEWAGKHILKKGKTATYDVLDEISPSPLLWFRIRFIEGLRLGKIFGGRETAKSPTADLFFTRLADGDQGLVDIVVMIGGYRMKVDLDNIPWGKQTVPSEIAYYAAHSGLFLRRADAA